MPLVRMDLAPDAADTARSLFSSSAQSFRSGIEEIIEFDPGYHLQEGECFRISDFEIDPVIMAGCRQPLSVDRLNPNMISNLPIRSIIGYEFTNGNQQIYFQNFDSRRVMIPGRRFAVFAMADTSTFEELGSPVILLDAPLVAIWDSGTLLFKSFSLAKRVFDLSTYFNDATDEQIRQFASHARFACDDSGALLNSCTEWYRKKIALILSGGILDEIVIESLTEAGESVGYTVPMNNNRIQLPSDKKELRILLQFLDEDIYKGPISHRQLVSSGKRTRS